MLFIYAIVLLTRETGCCLRQSLHADGRLWHSWSDVLVHFGCAEVYPIHIFYRADDKSSGCVANASYCIAVRGCNATENSSSLTDSALTNAVDVGKMKSSVRRSDEYLNGLTRGQHGTGGGV